MLLAIPVPTMVVQAGHNLVHKLPGHPCAKHGGSSWTASLVHQAGCHPCAPRIAAAQARTRPELIANSHMTMLMILMMIMIIRMIAILLLVLALWSYNIY